MAGGKGERKRERERERGGEWPRSTCDANGVTVRRFGLNTAATGALARALAAVLFFLFFVLTRVIMLPCLAGAGVAS